MKLAINIFLWVLCVALVSLVVAAVVVPKVIGGVPLTVLTGSMQPVLRPGDLVVVKPVAADSLRPGDVVTFQPVSNDPTVITHRIVSRSVTNAGVSGFTTRGDANGVDDEPIKADQVRGKVLYSLPKVGFIAKFIQSDRDTIITGVGVFLVGLSAVLITTDVVKRKKRGDDEYLETA